MSTGHVNRELGASLLITTIALSLLTGIIAYTASQLVQNNISDASQVSEANEARTAALVGIDGFEQFVNKVQSTKNTATSIDGGNCNGNFLCSGISKITSFFWGNSNDQIVPPNGGMGALAYFNGKTVSINNVPISNQKPYIRANVSLRILGNTYQMAIPATSNTAAQPAEPGLITVISQGTSGRASATAEAVLGPVMADTPTAVNTTLSLGGGTAGKIINQMPPSQHSYLNDAKTLTSTTPPIGFSGVVQNTGDTFVSISASTLSQQANILFIPPQGSQSNPRIEFQNIKGNSELQNGTEYTLSQKVVSKGICTFSFFGICLGNRIPIFAQGTNLSYSSGTWSISGPASDVLLIPGAAFFNGSVDLESGTYYNAIISNGNITDSGTVYAPNYEGASGVCGSSLGFFPQNLCGPQGTQFIPASIGNIALYADGNVTIGNGVSVYGDVLTRHSLTTDNSSFYGFVVAEGDHNSLQGTTTINNEQAPETFSATPLNATQYSDTTPSYQTTGSNPVGLLGLTWIN